MDRPLALVLVRRAAVREVPIKHGACRVCLLDFFVGCVVVVCDSLPARE